MRMIPNDFWNQNFFTPFRFGGIPETPKNFFSKNIFFKKFLRAQFSIFFDGTGLKWKIFQFRTYVQSRFRRFLPLGVRKIRKSDPTVKILVFGTPQTTLGKSCQNRLCTYVRNWNIFHLRPVPSKNIENCALENFLKKIFSKKNRGFGDSPKTKRGKKFLISEIVRNHSHGHFKPLLGQFGCKMEEWRSV